jgi:uncharacterized membrane protein YedE/YeeE
MTNFTPLPSLLGGVLIGLSASAMLILTGKIAGISGMLGGIVMPRRGETAWRVCFVAGLLVGGAVLTALTSSIRTYPQPIALTAIAGLLVGAGTRVSGGCTSGHGLCGISRLSTRSIVATLTFMATGAISVLVFHHLFARGAS